MKTIAILFLSLVMAKSCQDKKEAVEVKPIGSETLAVSEETKPKTGSVTNEEKQESDRIAEYEASTRGFFYKIKFSNIGLTVSKDRNNAENGTPIKITKEEVSELNTLLQAINPESLPEMKGPTEKRFYDGAAHANLTITLNGKTFAGAGFDHGFPPAAIEKFVNRLTAIAGKE